ncbi:hypothetical protein L484_004148 [Morus notabilis]|uniref:Uncharacterized protein n=1 Tax=Morus notabilis TaxID=981085 RepID=W9R0R1_9ROSA|nr:hypothetical protein L484_004148 [Morus notabilis]
MAALSTPSLQASLQPFQSRLLPSYPRAFRVSFSERNGSIPSRALSCLRFSRSPSLPFVKFAPFASRGETEATETEEILEQPYAEMLSLLTTKMVSNPSLGFIGSIYRPLHVNVYSPFPRRKPSSVLGNRESRWVFMMTIPENAADPSYLPPDFLTPAVAVR